MKTNLLLQEYLTLIKKSHKVLLGFEKVAQKGNFQESAIIACELGRGMTGA
jgi:hypothetical protein